MGNMKSESLRNKYDSLKYQIVDSFKDNHLGLYAVLLFKSNKQEQLCMQRIVNPNSFNQTIDEKQLIKNISTSHKNLAEFYFNKPNVKNGDLVDLLFEYGPSVQSPLAKEKYIWILVQQILDPLILFEQQY